MSVGLVREITSDYKPGEAWFYDKYISPAVMEVHWLVPKFHSLEPLPEGARILDAGCGGGQMVVRMAEQFPHARVTGIDISPQQLQRARRRGARFGDRAEFHRTSVLEMPFPDGHFDRVYSMLSLKHWPDVGRGIRECARVLRPGGWMVMVEVDRGCTLKDARTFIGKTRIPSLLKPIWLPVFRTWVAGQSVTSGEIRDHYERLGFGEIREESLPHTPAFGVLGRKRA